MSVLPPSKSDFIGGDSHPEEHAFKEKHHAAGVLLGRSCHLAHSQSGTPPKALRSIVRSRVSSREYFSRKKKVTQNWVSQVVESLSDEQLVGQLLFYSLSTNHDIHERELVEELIRCYGIGGIRCKQEHPKKRFAWVNHFQGMSDLPLLIGEDVCWTFEDNFSLYGGRPEEEYFHWGKSIAEYFKYMSVHFAFIPLSKSTINRNEDILELNDKRAWLFIKGLQDASIGVVLRQHLGKNGIEGVKRLPLYGHFASKLNQGDKAFVRMVFESGMSYVVCRDALAPESLTDSQGIVFCDVSERFVQDLKGADIKISVVKSFFDGADGFLLTHATMPVVFKALLEALKEGVIVREYMKFRVKKFLLAKEWAGLHEQRYVDATYQTTDQLAKGYLQSLEAKI